MRFRETWSLVRQTASDWSEDNAATQAAALAYYALLSLAPLLVISVSVAGWFLGPEAAKGQVAGELGNIVGNEAAQGIQTVVAHAQAPARSIVGTIVGVISLFFGASGVFGQLQASLNAIWEVKPRPDRGLLGQVKDRFFSFTMVLGVAFLLLVSLVLSSMLSAVGHVLSDTLPGGALLWQIVNFAVSFGIITTLFALIFKVIPDAQVQWRDVWWGALFTALLFTVGKQLLGIYLGKAALGSAYGAAGSIVALVVWVYYASQILFVGAELTQVQARRRGREIQPARGAERATPPAGAGQTPPPASTGDDARREQEARGGSNARRPRVASTG